MKTRDGGDGCELGAVRWWSFSWRKWGRVAMMVVSFEGERMIGNLALALFISSKKTREACHGKLTSLLLDPHCSLSLSLSGEKERENPNLSFGPVSS